MSTLTTGGTVGLGIKRLSASKEPDTSVKTYPELAILVDVSSCIGCKACEAACQQWHDTTPPILSPEEVIKRKIAGYQTHPDLLPETFMLMKFKEGETSRGFTWFITKYQCMHCREPGCLIACPSPGAVIQYQNGVVDFDHSKCIGCKMCLVGCPFDIPRYDKNNKPWKCNFCIDRVSAGLEPACVKTCPTNCLSFGFKEDMIERGKKIVERLKERGYPNATLYDPPGVGGTGYIYVLPHGDHVKDYQLPENPRVDASIGLWKGPLKTIGSIAFWGTLLGVFLQLILWGPIKVLGGKEEKSEEG
ncbi:formate dehydrogenase subunit beta [Aquifex aeolicus]|uniref:Formate dehydrogenase beta subunit n=1 Tax=Aquifex aeolicus (strain VF5) TaxID=224324 RepID=O67147_AQUAE|nr:formate dehydrogenase subunit beta [Aquifex aeolicus]AAC07108.1 formate dehydrogenase beta subunit [Aquifex aeolicus VF5]